MEAGRSERELSTAAVLKSRAWRVARCLLSGAEELSKQLSWNGVKLRPQAVVHSAVLTYPAAGCSWAALCFVLWMEHSPGFGRL